MMHSLNSRKLALIGIIGLCLLPSILNLLGLDFSSSAIPLTAKDTAEDGLTADKSVYSLRGALYHVLLEWAAIGVVFVASLISIVHYYYHRNVTIPIIGMALFFTGSMAAYHTLTAIRAIEASSLNPDYIPFTWAYSRICSASIMILGLAVSLWISSKSQEHNKPLSRRLHSPSTLALVGAAFLILAYLSLSWISSNNSVPQTMFPKVLLSRPYDILPLALFIFSGALIWTWYQRDKHISKFALLLSVFPEITTQLHMAFGSIELFDNHFNIAHVMKIVSYFIILVGFILELGTKPCKQIDIEPSKNDQPPQALPLNTDLNFLTPGKASRPLSIIIPFCVFALSLSISTILSISFYTESEQLVKKQISRSLESENRVVYPIIEQYFKEATTDIQFLSLAPPVQALVEASNNKNEHNTVIWRSQLETIFESVMLSKAIYTDIRFIGVANSSREIVNVYRQGENIKHMPTTRYTQFNRDAFFHQALKRNPGDVYYSAVELEKKRGELILPYRPLLRVATPIFNKDTDEIFGIINLTLDFSETHRRIKKTLPKKITYLLANAEYSYLHHTDPRKEFDFEKNSKFRLNEEFPELKNTLEKGLTTYILNETNERYPSRINTYSKMQFNQHGSTRPLHLLLSYDAQDEYQDLHIYRNRSLILGSALAIIALALSILFFRRCSRPLNQLTQAVNEYEKSGEILPLPIHSRDELGVFARGFYNLLLRVDNGLARQKQLVSNAKESSDRLEAIVNSAADAIISINKKGVVLTFNKTAEAIFGYSPEEIIGRELIQLMPQEHAEHHAEYIEKYLETGRSSIIGVGRKLVGARKNNQNFPIHLTITEVSTVQGPVFIGVVRDISKQVKIEAEKDKSLALLSATLESTDNGILITDDNNQVIQFNKRFSELWKINRTDIDYTLNDNLLPHIENQLLDFHMFSFDDELADDLPATPVTDTLSLIDNRILERVSMPMQVEGQTLGRVWSFRDITERAKHEEALLNAKNEAEQAVVAKSEFLATMSHEIRTPMNGVLGMLNLLLSSTLNTDQRHKTQLAQTSARSLLTLINDILDFSKVEAGKLKMESLDFNLRNLLGDFSEAMALRAHEKNIELILDVTQIHHSMVKGDPGRLRQIFTNLVGNAIKFTEGGEVIIRAQLHEAKNGHHQFDCSISDTGIGIPENKIEHMFESFTQVDASTTRQFGGTGLGLSIAKKLCQLMGGDISVQSKLSVGSTFHFTIQLDLSQKSSEVMPSVDIKNLPVLIVDDNLTNLEVLNSQLSHWGAKVTQCSSAREALDLLHEGAENNYPSFSAAFLDMQMPHMNGEQLAIEMQADRRFKHIPLVIMSSISARGDARYFANLGFSAYFPKPATTINLLNALTVLIDGSNALHAATPLVTAHYLNELSRNSDDIRDIEWPSATRILLVEDNPINQEVAVGTLEELGLLADVAGNGIEALEMLKQATPDAPYTLVLMDCQMPEMDGFEATQQIRNTYAGIHNRDIPIIAMTANAMAGDEQRCIKAGMSDYLSKPIDVELLKQRLKKWIFHEEPDAENISATPEAVNDAEEELPTKTFAIHALCPAWDIEDALKRVRGKRERLEKLGKSVLKALPADIDGLKNAIDAGDKSIINATAHGLKGVCSNFSAERMVTLLKAIERAQKENNLAQLQQLKNTLDEEYEQLVVAIETFLDAAPSQTHENI